MEDSLSLFEEIKHIVPDATKKINAHSVFQYIH